MRGVHSEGCAFSFGTVTARDEERVCRGNPLLLRNCETGAPCRFSRRLALDAPPISFANVLRTVPKRLLYAEDDRVRTIIQNATVHSISTARREFYPENADIGSQCQCLFEGVAKNRLRVDYKGPCVRRSDKFIGTCQQRGPRTPFGVSSGDYEEWQSRMESTVILRQVVSHDLPRPILDVTNAEAFLDFLLAWMEWKFIVTPNPRHGSNSRTIWS